MRSTMTLGLLALQLIAGVSAHAQNYYIKIHGDQYTHVADHASWEQGISNLDESLDAYNLDMPDGKKAIGTMRFQGATGNLSYATHYRLNSTGEQLVARKIVIFDNSTDGNFFVVAEKWVEGTVKGGAVLHYKKGNGSLAKSWELKALPSGFTFIRIFDAIREDYPPYSVRILCTVKKEGKQSIAELLFNPGTGQYQVLQYSPATLAAEKYNSVYYVRSNHYGADNVSENASFYGMGTYNGESIAFCNWGDTYEQYSLLSLTGNKEVAGVQMSGSSASSGNPYRINMAFIDADGDICMQQKEGAAIRNWRRAYHLVGGKLRMSMGSDGHGTKDGNGMHYFIAGALHPNFSDHEGRVTTLHYNALDGSMTMANIWNFSGIGIPKGIGFPNATDDPYVNYSFIADRSNQQHGFKFGTGNASTTGAMPCTELHELKEATNTLREQTAHLNTISHGIYNASSLNMVKVTDLTVTVIPECETEQRGLPQTDATPLLAANSTIQMNAENLHVTASGKTIAALQLLSIDGRLITAARNVNSSNYQQRFTQLLSPGIYVINISYSDQSTEVRKISIQ